MRTIFYLFLIMSFAVVSCGSKEGTTDNTNSTKDSTQTKDPKVDEVVASKLSTEANFDSIPTIQKLCTELSQESLRDTLGIYANWLIKKDDIKNKEDLQVVLNTREYILKELHAKVFDIITAKSDTIAMSEVLFNELSFLGIGISTAEGMYFGIHKADLLRDLVMKYSTGIEKLKMEYEYASNYANNGEYPYNDAYSHLELISIYEQMEKQYPNDPVTKELKSDAMNTLQRLADYHAVVSDIAMPILGGLSLDAYPTATSPIGYKKFLEKFPNSKYAPIFEKIINDPSTIQRRKSGEGYLDTYIVITDVFDDRNQALEKVATYLKNGQDIPHIIPLQEKEGEKTKFYVAYRFYPNKAKAEKLKEEISKNNPSTFLLTVAIENSIPVVKSKDF